MGPPSLRPAPSQSTWWEASDWRGYVELGAHKRGSDGVGLWEESWEEKMSQDPTNGQTVIERRAHKMYSLVSGETAWEESWSERYLATGPTHKAASKWARQGSESWNERRVAAACLSHGKRASA